MTRNSLRPALCAFPGRRLRYRFRPAPAGAQKAEPCIAGSWELTGALAHTGNAVQIGIEAAVDEINEAGGVLGKKLRVIAYDDQGEPARAVDNARRIGERDNCIIMIGGYRTPNALAIRTVLSEMGQPWMGVISAGTRVIEWESGKNEWMFRVSAKDRWVAPFLVDNAVERSKNKKIGFMFEATGWGQGAVPDVEAAAKAKGVTLVGKETFNIADQDMSAQLIRLRDAGADTLIFYARRPRDRRDPAQHGPHRLQADDRQRLGHRRAARQDRGRRSPKACWCTAPSPGPGKLSPRAQKVWERIKAKEKLKDPSELVLPSGTANAYDAVLHHRRSAQDRRRVRQEEAARRVLQGEARGHHRQLQPGLREDGRAPRRDPAGALQAARLSQGHPARRSSRRRTRSRSSDRAHHRHDEEAAAFAASSLTIRWERFSNTC